MGWGLTAQHVFLGWSSAAFILEMLYALVAGSNAYKYLAKKKRVSLIISRDTQQLLINGSPAAYRRKLVRDGEFSLQVDSV
jgi:hypothetical protein